VVRILKNKLYVGARFLGSSRSLPLVKEAKDRLDRSTFCALKWCEVRYIDIAQRPLLSGACQSSPAYAISPARGHSCSHATLFPTRNREHLHSDLRRATAISWPGTSAASLPVPGFRCHAYGHRTWVSHVEGQASTPVIISIDLGPLDVHRPLSAKEEGVQQRVSNV